MMSRIVLFTSLLIAILISLQSCENKPSEFEKYLEQGLNEKVSSENDLYIVFKRESCGYCLNKTKEVLENYVKRRGKTNNLHLVIAGYSQKDINLFLENTLIENCDIIYDLNEKLLNSNFYEDNNFYVYYYLNDKLKDEFYYNSGKDLDKFENIFENVSL